VKNQVAYWARMAGVTVAAAAVVIVVFFGVGFGTPAGRAARAFGVALAYSACIAPLAAVLVPRIGARVLRRLPAPVNWMVLVASMIPISLAGSAIATLALTAAGYFDPSSARETFTESAYIALLVTPVFGVVVSAYEFLRTELEQQRAALRISEREEADARRLTALARLGALEARVHPHFLFNTLNSIASLIPSDPTGAERMVTQLASLLRSSLDAESSPLIPLDLELRTVRNYLEIERVRLGDRLRFEIDVPDALLSVPVPRLAIQTLVENSVKHAAAVTRQGAFIRIDAQTSGNRLALRVSDTGPGLGIGREQAGHGLTLVRERLQMLDRGAAHLTIESSVSGASATIDLPLTASDQP
jgi:hypothetical protein